MPTLIKIPGGKKFLHKWIIEHFPANYTELNYFEPFFGGGSVFFNKKRSLTENINDADLGLCDLLICIQNSPKEIANQLKQFEFSEETFKLFLTFNPTNQFDNAIREYVLRRMSRSGLCKHFSRTTRLRGGRNEGLNSWANSIDNIPYFSQLLQNVRITNRDFIFPLIEAKENSFIYCDPPYLHSTRVSKSLYKNEMNEGDHIDFLKLCLSSASKILVSGYDSELYNDYLQSWNKVEKEIVNHTSQQKKKPVMKEILWSNYEILV